MYNSKKILRFLFVFLSIGISAFIANPNKGYSLSDNNQQTKAYYQLINHSLLGTYLYNNDSLIYPTSGDNSNLLLGNPSSASAVYPNNFLLNGLYFTVSYNRGNATPNWVSWHLNQDCLGRTKRSKGGFYPNTDLPAGWYQVLSSDYTGSGFDRGHQCPSADRTSSKAANTATFITTNIVPQAPNNNRKTWANLENYTRSLVEKGKEAYIICGVYGIGGTGSKGAMERIANGKIVVPDRLWKVIIVLENGNNDLNRIDTNTRIIAVNMPNTNDLTTDWTKFKVTPKSIEEATGYSLFSKVPEAIRQVLLNKIDPN